jgi:hypothetical protein
MTAPNNAAHDRQLRRLERAAAKREQPKARREAKRAAGRTARGAAVMTRYDDAIDLADDVEALVRRAEATLERATDATERDVLETELRETLALQDQVLEAVAPTIEAREREVDRLARRAIEVAAYGGGPDWHLKHRKFMSAAVKARIVALYGRRVYERLPW